MPKFLVDVTGKVTYFAHIVLEASSEVEAEALALSVMPSISKETCSDNEDIEDCEINEVSSVADDAEEPDTSVYHTYHTIHYAEKVGKDTWFVSSWNCCSDEYKVCVSVTNFLHPDGHFTEKGKFKDLEDAHESFQAFVKRARKALLVQK